MIRTEGGDGPWWRLKPGLMGLKRFMSDRIVRAAISEGYGWTRHYEPVCSDCPRLAALKATPPQGDET